MSNEKDSEICNYIKDDNINMLKKYSIDEIIISSSNIYGNIPLLIAVGFNAINCIHYFLDNNLSLLPGNNNDGYNIIMYAAREGLINMLKLFVEKGLDVNVTDNDNKNPLIYALLHQQKECVEYLINYTNINLNKALYLACFYGYMSLVKKLVLDKKCDINYESYNDRPLTASLKQKNIKVAKFLIKNNCEINYLFNDNKSKYTPLVYACKHNMLNIVKLLIEKKCDLNQNIESNCFNNALKYTIYNKKESEYAKLLIDTYCLNDYQYIESRPNSWNSILYSTIVDNNFEIFKYIIEKIPNDILQINIKHYRNSYYIDFGHTILHSLVKYNKIEMLKYILNF